MRNFLAARTRQALRAILVVAVVWAWTGLAEGAELVGELVSASGPVEVRPLGQVVWRVASQRMVLQPGDMVRTGPGGAAEVAFVSAVVRMDENTVIILPPLEAVPASAGNPSGLRLLLQGGRALFRVFKDRLQGTFEVITPSIIVGVKGTTFGVEQGPNLGVMVFEGIVDVAQAGRLDLPRVELRGGQYTILSRGRLTAPRSFEPGRPGPVWNGAPTKTTSNALPLPPGERLASGGPGAAPSQVATAPAGATPAPALEDVLSGGARGEVVGLSLSVPTGPTSGGATGLSASAPLAVTGSDPLGATAGGPPASSGGSLPAPSASAPAPGAGGLSGAGPSGASGSGPAGLSGGGPPGLSRSGFPGLIGGGTGDHDDGGRGHGRGGGPPGLHGGSPPGLVRFGGVPPGHGGGRR
jgi:hypothetical protein